MKEIIELNKRILTEAPEAVPKEFGFIMVIRNDSAAKELAALPASIRADFEKFLQKLNQAMPDDFEYQVLLGNEHPYLTIIYNDGAQTVGNCPVKWDLERSIFDQLPAINWDSLRGFALANGQMFDRMIEEAKQRPAALPSTKQLQKEFAEPMKDFIKTKRKDASKVHVLVWSEGQEGSTGEEFANMKAFCRALPDLMATQYLVITVVADGKPLPERKIEVMKREALKELEDMPISHAKALLKL